MTTLKLPVCEVHGPRCCRAQSGAIRSLQPRLPGQPVPRLRCRATEARQAVTAADEERLPTQNWQTKLAAAGAAAALACSSIPAAALANEFDLLSEPTPTTNFVLDDAGVLNRTTKKSLNDSLKSLEADTGYRLEVATVRKLETESDAFAFGDKLIEKWYENVSRGSNKGVLVVVTSGKDGALTGGPKFLKAVGDSLIDSIASENIPILTVEEKFNETVTSAVERVTAVLTGKEDPGPPVRGGGERKRTYRTKGETAKSKSITGTIVAALLAIAFVVPMVQYWGYTRKG